MHRIMNMQQNYTMDRKQIYRLFDIDATVTP